VYSDWFEFSHLQFSCLLSCSSIAYRNYPSGLVDRAPQDREQPLQSGRERLSSLDQTYPLSSKDQATRVLIKWYPERG
jgi:hypothetical protein